MSKLPSFVPRLLKQGPKRSLETLASVIEDRLFDRRYQCETSTMVEVSEYDPSLKHLAHAKHYYPARARAFRKMMDQLDLPADSVFVDIGCGMGRILLLASRYPFKRLVGVDLAEDLCTIAERNMKLLPEIGSDLPYEIHAEDVTEYDFKPDENVFFLFNPFDETIMAAFLAALQRSLDQAPRPLWLIYLKPLTAARQTIEQNGMFRRDRRIVYGDSEFVIYRASDVETSAAGAAVEKVA